MSARTERPGVAFTLFRGERASQTPDTVFANGFKPRGTNTDLLYHVSTNKAESVYVSTSRSKDIAAAFAAKNGFVYEIRTRHGIDINQALGSHSPFPEQLEVAVPNGLTPVEIVGAFPKANGKLTGEFIPNPNFSEG